MPETFRLLCRLRYSTLETAAAALKELSVRLHEDAAGLIEEARHQGDPAHRKRAEQLAAQERERAELYGRTAVELEADMKEGTKELDRGIKKRANHQDQQKRRYTDR